MTIRIDTASGTIDIEIQGSYTADQLLDLLKKLAAARAQVAKDPATPGAIWVAPQAACHAQLMGASGPDSLLAFRFPGIGWIGASLHPAMRAQLISLLAAQQAVVADPARAAAPPVKAGPAPEPEAAWNPDSAPDGTTVH